MTTSPTDLLPQALRLLGRFWLEEVKGEDLKTIDALPELAGALWRGRKKRGIAGDDTPNAGLSSQLDEATLTNLSVEYQRLFGFNLPPYESVFIDPSGMLMAPAALRVQTLYRQGGWQLPPQLRVGALDHLGVELEALADWWKVNPELAQQLLTRHLALWLPPFMLALRRLRPHPFYATLGELTLELILAMLPEAPLPDPATLFPVLPSPPVYKGSDQQPPEELFNLRHLIQRLLSPREAGLYFTREDLAQVSYRLALPTVMGERYRMLETLVQQASQYDLLAALSEQLMGVLVETKQAYHDLTENHPTWAPYAEAWGKCLETTRGTLEAMSRVANEV